MIKGLFGRKPNALPGYGGGMFEMGGRQQAPAYSMPQDMTVRDTGMDGMAKRQKPKFFSAEGAGPLVFSALADLGERINGGQGDNLGSLMGFQLQQRQQAAQQAAALRQAALERAQGLEDYRIKKGIDAEFEKPEGPDIMTVEDNVGNVFRFDKRTGQQIGEGPMFVDRSPRYTIQGNAAIRTPNPFDAPSGSGPQPGTVEDGFRFRGGNPSDPNNWEPVAGGTGGNVGGNFR
jgi:hypothetical protein